jgi:oxygen-dependent protoporphyrinogen oxidase
MAELPEALGARLRERLVDIRLSAPVERIARRGDGWSAELPGARSFDADAVVVALPAHAAAELLRPHAPDAASALAGIPHASTATVSLGYDVSDVPRALDATGYLVPRVEGRTALACTWTSAKFDGRAPAGRALFRVFLGGAARAPIRDLPDVELLRLAREELAGTVGVRAQPVISEVARQTDAMPQYLVGHRERIARVRRAADELHGLALAGNVYGGVGIPDCVRSGESAALRALASFRPEHE